MYLTYATLILIVCNITKHCNIINEWHEQTHTSTHSCKLLSPSLITLGAISMLTLENYFRDWPFRYFVLPKLTGYQNVVTTSFFIFERWLPFQIVKSSYQNPQSYFNSKAMPLKLWDCLLVWIRILCMLIVNSCRQSQEQWH